MKKVGLITSILSGFGLIATSAISGVNSQSPVISPDISTVQTVELQIVEPVIDTKDITSIEAIPYDTVSQNDNTLAKGMTKVLVDGVKGERTIVYRVTYTDGQETSRELISSTVTRQPISKVVAIGTYVAPKQNAATQYCQNGTYINSDGNVVCRPSTANTGGATAICRDGSYSYSQHRSGTCSHHGGVSRWL